MTCWRNWRRVGRGQPLISLPLWGRRRGPGSKPCPGATDRTSAGFVVVSDVAGWPWLLTLEVGGGDVGAAVSYQLVSKESGPYSAYINPVKT